MIQIILILLLLSSNIIFFILSKNNVTFEKIISFNILCFIFLIINDLILLKSKNIVFLLIIISLQVFWIFVIKFNTKDGKND